MAGPLEIRRARDASDWREIRAICCETGAGGEPIEPERAAFFGEYWIAPYERYAAETCWVAEVDGRVVGYLTACENTRALDRRRELVRDPWLALQVLTGRYERNRDTERFFARLNGLEVPPERAFSPSVRRELKRHYPAHLHMNVRAGFRDAGAGARLIEACFSELRARGVPGLHLFCGEKPVRFYQRHGLRELARLEYRTGVWVYALGVRL